MVLLWTVPASALPVFFDGVGGLGFNNENYGFDIDVETGNLEFREAAERVFNGVGGADPQFFVLVDSAPVFCPPEVASQCTNDLTIVDVTYSFELNANLSSSPQDLIIILAGLGPAPDPAYTPAAIGIEFDPGADALQVIRYTETGQTFLGMRFEDVVPGPLPQLPQLTFRYRIEEPLRENSLGQLALPGIGVAAFAVPEPSTGLLIAAGLGALSIRRRWGR